MALAQRLGMQYFETCAINLDDVAKAPFDYLLPLLNKCLEDDKKVTKAAPPAVKLDAQQNPNIGCCGRQKSRPRKQEFDLASMTTSQVLRTIVLPVAGFLKDDIFVTQEQTSAVVRYANKKGLTKMDIKVQYDNQVITRARFDALRSVLHLAVYSDQPPFRSCVISVEDFEQ